MRYLGLILLFLLQESAAQKTGSNNVTFTFPGVALMTIAATTSKDINLTYSAPADPGQILQAPAANSGLWLNFTSATSATQTRKIQVHLETPLPAGLSLVLQLAGPTGAGAGVRGTPLGSNVVLSTGAQDIITGIKGAYTGIGVGNGYQLTYSTSITQIADLRQRSVPINITFTFTDQ